MSRYLNRNHDASNMCSALRGSGFAMKRCYAEAVLVATAPASGYREQFCHRHASWVRKGMGSSIFATLVRAGVATLTAKEARA